MFLLIVIATFLVDQLSKIIIQSLLGRGESIPVLPPLFYLTYVLNPGAAFGILANQTVLFIVAAILAIGGVMAGYRRLPAGRILLHLGLGLTVGGAAGNLADRLRFGQVVDFLDFRVWPVFNLADTAIVIGAGLLIWDLLHSPGGGPKKGSEPGC